MTPPFWPGFFEDLKHQYKAFVDLGLFNEAGVHVAYVGPYQLKGRDYGDADWFRESHEQGVVCERRLSGGTARCLTSSWP